MSNRDRTYSVTFAVNDGEGNISETVTEYKVRRGAGCVHCNHQGEILAFYERPGGNPGNQMIPCPHCYKDDKPASAEVRAALDELKAFDGG